MSTEIITNKDLTTTAGADIDPNDKNMETAIGSAREYYIVSSTKNGEYSEEEVDDLEQAKKLADKWNGVVTDKTGKRVYAKEADYDEAVAITKWMKLSGREQNDLLNELGFDRLADNVSQKYFSSNQLTDNQRTRITDYFAQESYKRAKEVEYKTILNSSPNTLFTNKWDGSVKSKDEVLSILNKDSDHKEDVWEQEEKMRFDSDFDWKHYTGDPDINPSDAGARGTLYGEASAKEEGIGREVDSNEITSYVKDLINRVKSEDGELLYEETVRENVAKQFNISYADTGDYMNEIWKGMDANENRLLEFEGKLYTEVKAKEEGIASVSGPPADSNMVMIGKQKEDENLTDEDLTTFNKTDYTLEEGLLFEGFTFYLAKEGHAEKHSDIIFENKLYTCEGLGNCAFCGGKGKVTVERRGLKDCPDCDGTGDIESQPMIPNVMGAQDQIPQQPQPQEQMPQQPQEQIQNPQPDQEEPKKKPFGESLTDDVKTYVRELLDSDEENFSIMTRVQEKFPEINYDHAWRIIKSFKNSNENYPENETDICNTCGKDRGEHRGEDHKFTNPKANEDVTFGSAEQDKMESLEDLWNKTTSQQRKAVLDGMGYGHDNTIGVDIDEYRNERDDLIYKSWSELPITITGYHEEKNIRRLMGLAGGAGWMSESCGCKRKSQEANIKKYKTYVTNQITILQKRAKVGESVSLMYGLPTMSSQGKKVKGKLAYAGVSLNDRIYLPEELAKGHGRTLPLLLNHSSTAGAEEELDRLDDDMRSHLENEEDYQVGEVTLTWDPEQLTLFYEGVIDHPFFQQEVDDMDMAVSLGIYYDSDSPQVCDENCYTLIKGAEFREVSLVYHAGFPIATIEAVEAELKRKARKAKERTPEEQQYYLDNVWDDNTGEDWVEGKEIVPALIVGGVVAKNQLDKAEEELDELVPTGQPIDVEEKPPSGDVITIEEPLVAESLITDHNFSVRGIMGMTISNSNGVERYILDPNQNYGTNMIHFDVSGEGAQIYGEELQLQPKMTTPPDLTKEIEKQPDINFTEPDEDAFKKKN